MFDDYLYEMMDIADLFAQNMGGREGYKQVKETIRNRNRREVNLKRC
ncbi:MAG: hypothetical protein ACLU4J_08540 [Butyricimonas paravirosa]